MKLYANFFVTFSFPVTSTFNLLISNSNLHSQLLVSGITSPPILIFYGFAILSNLKALGTPYAAAGKERLNNLVDYDSWWLGGVMVSASDLRSRGSTPGVSLFK